MTSPSQMSLRRIPDELRLKVRIAYAAAWEALIETHSRQALEFVCEFAPRLPPLEALNLFFQIIAVPQAMQESIVCRTLIGLDLESLPPLRRPPELTGWQRLRPDLQLGSRRRRRRYDEKTVELAHMLGARVAERVISTHVQNAVEFTAVLDGVMPVNAAIDRYLYEFVPIDGVASMVGQRVRARVASAELIAQDDEPLPASAAPEVSAEELPVPPVSEAPPAPTPVEPTPPHVPEEAPPSAEPSPHRLRILP